MFFTRIGTIIAHLMFWGSLFGFAMALLGALNLGLTVDGGQPYPKNPSKAMDFNLRFLFFGVLLGVVCEISSRVNKAGERASEEQA